MGEHRPAEAGSGISSGLILLLAVSCGISVANLYYAQPLLHTIGHDFGAGSGSTGLIVTLSQIGYALGLALLLPVGDLIARRKLVPCVLVVTAAAMAASALAPDLPFLIAVSLLVGLGSVATQIMVPLAAHLAPDERRGQVVGRVMAGLLIGILVARTLSGLVAGASSWRVVYWAGAGLALILAAVLSRALPEEGERPHMRYGELLQSTVKLFFSEPLLRRRAGYGALGFGAFSVFWTTMAFLVGGPHYRYSDTAIGLFGLVGAAGALSASPTGRWADRGHAALMTGIFAVLLGLSVWPIWLGRHSLAWLIVGIVGLDIATQGMQVTNQGLVYALAPQARSRINSAYMVCYFIGGSLGSAVGGAAYDAGGWTAVCLLGGGIGLAAVLGFVADRVRPVTVVSDDRSAVPTSATA